MSERPLKITKQRAVILEELRKLKTHPTATELYELVRKRIPRISLGTVYRNLEVLADAGIIRKIETAGTQKRFDAMIENHYHVRCVNCGRVDDLPVPPIREIEDVLHGFTDYKISSYRLEFQGLCPICKDQP